MFEPEKSSIKAPSIPMITPTLVFVEGLFLVMMNTAITAQSGFSEFKSDASKGVDIVSPNNVEYCGMDIPRMEARKSFNRSFGGIFCDGKKSETLQNKIVAPVVLKKNNTRGDRRPELFKSLHPTRFSPYIIYAVIAAQIPIALFRCCKNTDMSFLFVYSSKLNNFAAKTANI